MSLRKKTPSMSVYHCETVEDLLSVLLQIPIQKRNIPLWYEGEDEFSMEGFTVLVSTNGDCSTCLLYPGIEK